VSKAFAVSAYGKKKKSVREGTWVEGTTMGEKKGPAGTWRQEKIAKQTWGVALNHSKKGTRSKKRGSEGPVREERKPTSMGYKRRDSKNERYELGAGGLVLGRKGVSRKKEERRRGAHSPSKWWKM